MNNPETPSQEEPEKMSTERAEQILSQDYISKDDITIIIEEVHDEDLKEKAWDKFLVQEPNAESFIFLLINARSWRNKIAEQIIARESSNSTLLFLLKTIASKEWKAKAAEKLLSQNPSKEILYGIIESAPEPYDERAKKLL